MDGLVPRPPDGMRPGQLGVVILGRVIIGDIAVTLVEFCTDQGQQALTGPLLPYAMHFGLIRDDDLPLVRFARNWVTEFSALPGWHSPPPKAPDPLSEPVPKSDTFYGLTGLLPRM
jgi:hypothetical protein